MILKAHRAAFLRIYAFGDFISRSTSPAKSRAISGDAIAPKVHNAKPTTNCVVEFKSLKIKKFVYKTCFVSEVGGFLLF